MGAAVAQIMAVFPPCTDHSCSLQSNVFPFANVCAAVWPRDDSSQGRVNIDVAFGFNPCILSRHLVMSSFGGAAITFVQINSVVVSEPLCHLRCVSLRTSFRCVGMRHQLL